MSGPIKRKKCETCGREYTHRDWYGAERQYCCKSCGSPTGKQAHAHYTVEKVEKARMDAQQQTLFVLLERPAGSKIETVIAEAPDMPSLISKLTSYLQDHIEESEGKAAASFVPRSYRIAMIVADGGVKAEPDGKREVRLTLSEQPEESDALRNGGSNG